MGDGYNDSPGSGYGYTAGPPPGAVAGLLLLLLVIVLLLAIGAFAYRQGMAAERRRIEQRLAKSGEVIFHAVRTPLNGALLATGERVFAPARSVLETIDLYVGPLLAMMGGLAAIQNLRKAILDPKHPKPDHPNGHGKSQEGGRAGQGGHAPAPGQPIPRASGGQTIIIAAPMAVSAGESAPAVAKCGCGCGCPGGQCGRGAPGDPPPVTSKEHARMVRDALEALADYWQEDQVKPQILAAQKALMISRPIGTVGERAAERAGLFAARARPASNTGSLMRPYLKPKG